MNVTVVGMPGPVPDAPLVVGSAAHLALVEAPEKVELGPLTPALDRLVDGAVVLAGGDPGLFGIVRALREAGHECTVLPAVSSVAAAYARIGLPWDDAVVVSAHGRALAPAVNACRAFGSVAVLTGPGAGPVDIARALDGWPRELVVAERLGLPGERVTRAPADELPALEYAEPNVVLSLDPERVSVMRRDNQPAAAPECGWALPESAYAHRDSMITKAEVRAHVLARLRPRLGRLVLDVGAGSGAVGIECSLLGAAVICVERETEACRTIEANAAAHGARVRVVPGVAPAALAGLPDADAAFVGGGGLDVVRAVGAATVVAAFAALDHAVAAHETLSAAGYRVDGVQLAASRVTGLPGGSLRLAAANPVIVLTGERR